MARRLEEEIYGKALAELKRRAEAGRWPTPDLAGISMGGCCDAIGTDRTGSFRRKAHAHNHAGDEMRGWICFLSAKPEKLVAPSGRPTALFAHEYAHIMVPSAGHGERWRRAVTALGHPAEAKR
jgi:hypothetical protein